MTRKVAIVRHTHLINCNDQIMCGLPRGKVLETERVAETTCQACIGKIHPAFRPKAAP